MKALFKLSECISLRLYSGARFFAVSRLKTQKVLCSLQDTRLHCYTRLHTLGIHAQYNNFRVYTRYRRVCVVGTCSLATLLKDLFESKLSSEAVLLLPDALTPCVRCAMTPSHAAIHTHRRTPHTHSIPHSTRTPHCTTPHTHTRTHIQKHTHTRT